MFVCVRRSEVKLWYLSSRVVFSVCFFIGVGERKERESQSQASLSLDLELGKQARLANQT